MFDAPTLCLVRRSKCPFANTVPYLLNCSQFFILAKDPIAIKPAFQSCPRRPQPIYLHPTDKLSNQFLAV